MPTIESKQDALGFILGADLRFPLSGSFATLQGLETLIQDIQLLLLTIPGERVSEPEYGCGLRSLLWENLDTIASEGAILIKQALDTFEPRITVTTVVADINRNSDLVNFSIRFSIKQTDTAANLIFPFRTVSEVSGA